MIRVKYRNNVLERFSDIVSVASDSYFFTFQYADGVVFRIACDDVMYIIID